MEVSFSIHSAGSGLAGVAIMTVVRETWIGFLPPVLAFQSALAFGSDPRSAAKYYLEALEAYHHFDYKAAENLLRKALQQDPNQKMADYKLGCDHAARLSQDPWSWLKEIGPNQDPRDWLARVIQIDPEPAQRAADDPYFAKIRLIPIGMSGSLAALKICSSRRYDSEKITI